MTIRGPQLAVIATCLVAAVSYAGAVRVGALAYFVLPGVAVAGLLASLLVTYRLLAAALIVGGLLVLGWSEVVNVWSGTADGPAARSTFFAAGWTVVAIVAANSPWPALFLEGAAGVIVGALVLGAGGEVSIVAVVTSLCAAVTLGLIERSRRKWSAPPRRSVAVLTLSLLAAAAAVGVVLLQVAKDPTQPAVVARGEIIAGIRPPWHDPLTRSRPNHRHTHRSNLSARSHHPPGRAHHRPPPARHHVPARKHAPPSSSWPYVVLGIALAVLALALLVGARLLATRLAWRRVRRRLTAGAPDEQVTGAWAWARMRLEACRMPLAVEVSPDAVAAGRVDDDLPSGVFTPLRELATTTTTAAFAPERPIGVGEAAAAWTAAGRTEASARELLTRRDRARLAFRGPVSKVPAR